MGIIDYWCNAFAPDRQALWDASIAEQGVPLKVRRDPDDSFADAATLVKRMDDLGIDTLLLPTGDLPAHAGVRDDEPFASRPEELRELRASHPGRFAGLWSVDPRAGMAGVRRAADALDELGCVGLHSHTHSFDLRFDDRAYYPYYTLAAERGLAVVVQAGSSGGLMPSECGQPIGIDRPALYFRDTRFVLSHTGWPWVDEAIAMGIKHPNVFVGTAAYPPHHWGAELLRFLCGPGRGKTLFGTGFPVVGHRHALGRLAELDLGEVVRHELVEGAARRVFPALGE